MQPKFNFLYSGDPERDKGSLLHYIDEVGATLNVHPVEVDGLAIDRILASMQSPPWRFPAEQTSPFKKIAAFVTNFVQHKPIITPFPVEKFKELHNHQNAIVAHTLSVDALHNANIQCPFRGPVVLDKRITTSIHYWKELIALLDVSTAAHFPYISLIYEALAYECNPDASYKRVMSRMNPTVVVE